MSLDDAYPTEYYGPHAKRWTNPRTGITLSLKPRDYYQLVAEEKAKIEAAAAANVESLEREIDAQLKERFPDHYVEGATPEKVEQAMIKKGWVEVESAPLPGWPNVISTDGTTDGTEIAPLGGWNPPEHQRYEKMEMGIPPEMAGRYDAIVYGATRGGIKYPTPAETAEQIDRNQAETKRVLAEANTDLTVLQGGGGLLVSGRLHSAIFSRDGMGYVSSSPAAPSGVRSGERPAGRHWRHRRPQRIARWFAKFGRHPRLWVATGLVYIIAIIGVAAVTGVFS